MGCAPSHAKLRNFCHYFKINRLDFVRKINVRNSHTEWRAPKVGLTDDEVSAIEEDNSKAERKRISFLEKWKQKFAMKATYRVLIESLLGIKRVEDARGVCQVLKGEQHS